MATQVQIRRGTNTQNASFTGAEGELSANTTNDSVHVHDGSTAGGFELARADLNNVSDTDLNAALTGNTLASLTITSADINGGNIDGTTIGGSTAAAGTFTTFTSNGIDDNASATALTIDSSGRLGVGDTPNTNWRNDATDDVLMLGTEATLHSDAGVTTELWNNAYVNNSDTFKNISTRGASRYMQYSGEHKWFTAASASAGSTISTEINSSPKMVLDVSGNLGIGTSSVDRNLHIESAGDTYVRVSGNRGNANDLHIGNIEFENSFGSAGVIAEMRAITGNSGTQSSKGQLAFYTDDGSTYAERMRIGSDGGVDIGSPAGSEKLNVAGSITADGYIYPTTDNGWSLGLSTNRWGNVYAYNGNFESTFVIGPGGGVSQLQIFPAFSSGVNLIQNYSGSAYTTEEHRASDYKFKIGTGDAVTIDSNGAITAPSQPAFSAEHASGGSISFSINTATTIQLQTEIFDQGSDYNASTYQFTAPVTGKYQLNAHLRLNNVDESANYYVLYIKTSNRNYYHIIDPGAFDSDPGYWTMQVQTLADMDANDVAYVEILQSAGSNQTSYEPGSGSNGFSGYLVA